MKISSMILALSLLGSVIIGVMFGFSISLILLTTTFLLVGFIAGRASKIFDSR